MNVLITGGAGFLGRGIIRRAHANNWDWNITVFSRDEAKHVKVKSRWPDVRIIRGDVTEPVEQLVRAFTGHDLIIHAGANKLIDIGELHAMEVVRNNVFGSYNVAQAAAIAGVPQVIGISTDKAVQPVNTYGMTKAIMERLFQEANTWSDTTQFKLARYGNVVGSTISVILYFQEQLQHFGYIKLTNPEMTRFYMGVDEAIDVILHTMDKALAGSVVIPKMKAMSLVDTAKLVLGLPRSMSKEALLADKRVHVVGARPGEKVHEHLIHRQESVRVLSDQALQDQYFELRPVGEIHYDDEFEVTSADPLGGWMEFDEMKALIQDAANV